MKITNDLYISSKNRDVSNNDTLGKDAFLQILMTQLQNQDPLEPLKDKDFIAQMATFSSLEQLTNVNNQLTTLLEQNNKLSFLGLGELIGKKMSWIEEIKGDNGGFSLVNKEGSLQSVSFNNGTPSLVMEDGTIVPKDMITNILQTESIGFLEASHLIGKNVSWLKDGQENNAIVHGVRNENDGLKLRLNNDEVIELQDIISIAKDTAPSI